MLASRPLRLLNLPVFSGCDLMPTIGVSLRPIAQTATKRCGESMLKQHLSRQTIGYLYWSTITTRMGVRHVGTEMHGFMDDFGNLVAITP